MSPLIGIVDGAVDQFFGQHAAVGNDVAAPVPDFYNRMRDGDILHGAVFIVDDNRITDPDRMGSNISAT